MMGCIYRATLHILKCMEIIRNTSVLKRFVAIPGIYVSQNNLVHISKSHKLMAALESQKVVSAHL